jgi:hypothetical protein
MGTVTPLFAHAAFDAEATHVMGLAYEKTCEVLQPRGQRYPLAELVALKVIEFASRGVRDPEQLTGMTLNALLGVETGLPRQ